MAGTPRCVGAGILISRLEHRRRIHIAIPVQPRRTVIPPGQLSGSVLCGVAGFYHSRPQFFQPLANNGLAGNGIIEK